MRLKETKQPKSRNNDDDTSRTKFVTLIIFRMIKIDFYRQTHLCKKLLSVNILTFRQKLDAVGSEGLEIKLQRATKKDCRQGCIQLVSMATNPTHVKSAPS